MVVPGSSPETAMTQSCEGAHCDASSAGSAVDLMAASCFRSLAAVNGARAARRLWRPQAIDSRETSEVHASIRSTRCRVTDRGGAGGAAGV